MYQVLARLHHSLHPNLLLSSLFVLLLSIAVWVEPNLLLLKRGHGATLHDDLFIRRCVEQLLLVAAAVVIGKYWRWGVSGLLRRRFATVSFP